MGRHPNTEQRQTQIVTALMKVIARKGYAGASIQEIAQEAGLAPGLIHYHFESKQEILLALFNRLETLVNQRMESGIRKLGRVDPLIALDALIDAFLALDNTSDQLSVRCWTMISAEAVYNSTLSRAFKKVIHTQLQHIERVVQLAFDAKAKKEKAQIAAAAILAAIHGSFLLASTAPGAIPTGSAASSVKLMARGLLGKPDL
jgi:TetR/AcrR family transcriptional regulator, transcriptional repressor of bet genes